MDYSWLLPQANPALKDPVTSFFCTAITYQAGGRLPEIEVSPDRSMLVSPTRLALHVWKGQYTFSSMLHNAHGREKPAACSLPGMLTTREQVFTHQAVGRVPVMPLEPDRSMFTSLVSVEYLRSRVRPLKEMLVETRQGGGGKELKRA